MNTRKITKNEYPYLLRQLEKLPESMDIAGALPSDEYTFLCVIGARRFSNYGKEVCEKLITGLAGYPIVIVSGLAIGIDSIAHEAALTAKLKTVAFPGSGLDDRSLYPACRRKLAKRILENEGALISPFKNDQVGTRWTFPVRNQLMAGISHATLIIESRKRSGTLITAKAAGEFNRTLLAVPGSIFSELSEGPHGLLRDGATAVTTSHDILEALELTTHSESTQQSLLNLQSLSLSEHEKQIIDSLRGELLSSTEILEKTGLNSSAFNIAASELELRGLLVNSGGRYRLA
jgi:DNA processing protein